MEFISTIKASPVFPILTILVVSGIVYILRLSYRQREIIDTAKKNIRDAFKVDLDKFVKTDQDTRIVFNQSAFEKHRIIIRDNIDDLSFIQKIRLNRTWIELTTQAGDYEQSYNMYYDCGSLKKRRVVRPLIVKRIQNIISIVS